MRQLFTLALLCLPFLGSAQTYFYINSISVDPPAPTTSDPVTVTVHGDLSSTGAYIVSSNAQVFGNIVAISIVAADPGGFTVLVPHNEVFSLGLLPAGTYTMYVDSLGHVWDMASGPQHVFTVTGSTAVQEVTGGDVAIGVQGEQLTIDAADGAPLGAVEIVDATGKVVVTTQSTASLYRTDLTTAVPGVYVVRLADRGVTRRFLVQ
ncbi:MAG: T9SS type A sorting domain-containing protein [Flavobacteriales bacterium]|nr:T9SS type A sorting domain-containing protein [Flavobacteriales bacterium]